MQIRILTFLFLFLPFLAEGQKKALTDSLEKAAGEATSDTARFRLLSDLLAAYRLGNPEKAGETCDRLTELAEKIGEPYYKAKALLGQGTQSRKEGDYETAVKNYMTALTIFEDLKDEKSVCACSGSLGITYWQQDNYPLAINYLKKALVLSRKLGKRGNEGANLNNIAGVFMEQGKYDSALIYQEQVKVIYAELQDTAGLADAYGNTGAIYLKKLDTANALKNSLVAIRYSELTSYKYQLASSYANVGNIYQIRGEYALAKQFFEKALAVSEELHSLEGLSSNYKSMAELSHLAGEDTLAYSQLLKHLKFKDSLFSETRIQQLSEMEAKYQTAQKDKQLLAEKAQSERKTILLYSLIIGLALVLGLAFFTYRSYINKKRLSIEIQEQKEIIEVKSKEILDSIHYAERIQQALLPSDAFLKEQLPESFVLMKPKDIVAGDFYWLEHAGRFVFFAVADCTGHGVPGALVSVICSNALNRAVKEFGMTDPGKILDKVRQLVIESFEKSVHDVRDGMDISLCVYDKENRLLHWAGANNGLCCIRQGEALELRPDKQPIGKHPDQKPFTTQQMQLQPGDCLYLYTDGFADQFGGPDGKKFKYKQLKELLIAVSKVPMPEQAARLEKTFRDWKGALEQVDDVCLLGVRI